MHRRSRAALLLFSRSLTSAAEPSALALAPGWQPKLLDAKKVVFIRHAEVRSAYAAAPPHSLTCLRPTAQPASHTFAPPPRRQGFHNQDAREISNFLRVSAARSATPSSEAAHCCAWCAARRATEAARALALFLSSLARFDSTSRVECH